MSAQLRSCGGGGMHSSGYDAAQLVPGGGGGGGGGGGEVERQRKPRIGWSSIAFGATPVWPCLKSKNATPVRTAFVQSRTAPRTWFIWLRRVGVAPAVHEREGASAIMWLVPLWMTR